MTARLATHAGVADLVARVRDRLVAEGLDVEPGPVVTGPVLSIFRSGADLALVGMATLRGPEAEELTTLAVLQREDARDVLIGREGSSASLRSLRAGSRVGLTGVRRRAFLGAHRVDLEAVEVAPHEVEDAMTGGRIDAAVIAAVQARALGLGRRVTEILDPRAWLPEPGQGIVALVSRHPIAEATALDHLPTRMALRSEIALLDALDAHSGAAIGSLAQASGRWIRLWGAAASPDGRRFVRADLTGPLDEPAVLGSEVARRLAEQGAARVLAAAGR